MKIKLFHRRANGSVKIWMSEVIKTTIHTWWGVKGGKMSHTQDCIRSTSRETAEERVLRRFMKRVEGRKRKGYVEDLDAVVGSVQMARGGMNFERLPRDFAPAKPHKSIDMTDAYVLDTAGDLLIQRKRDGMRHYIVSDSAGQIKVYSSGKDNVTEHLWPLVEDLRLPPKTVLDAELVVTDLEGRDQFNAVSSVARSLPERAQKQIRHYQKWGWAVELFVFDCLYEAGEETWRKKYSERYLRISQLLKASEGLPYVRRMPLVVESYTKLSSLRQAMAQVKKHGWEGLVVWERNKSTMVRVNGSPMRINCHKIKPIHEEDVIATGYELGKGRNSGVVGKFRIAVRGPMGYESYIPMGKCGTGLDDDTRRDALAWRYPCVIQIEYDSKSEKGFRFPVYIRKRDDKRVSELEAVGR